MKKKININIEIKSQNIVNLVSQAVKSGVTLKIEKLCYNSSFDILFHIFTKIRFDSKTGG